MDKGSCIARRKLLCREWTAEEIRFIRENLAVLKHNVERNDSLLPNHPGTPCNMVFILGGKWFTFFNTGHD